MRIFDRILFIPDMEDEWAMVKEPFIKRDGDVEEKEVQSARGNRLIQT